LQVSGKGVCSDPVVKVNQIIPKISIIKFLIRSIEMAKAKSPSSGKTNRATNNIKDQTTTANPVIPDGNPIANTAAAPTPTRDLQPEAPEVKAAAPETKKFELHKGDSRPSDSRNKVVPINVDDEIRRRAYELSQQRGHGTGSPAEDWLAAEREVMQRYRQQRA
jgi:hypothetical protein